MKTECTHTTLASRKNFTVEICSCGWVSVHVGAMTLRLDTASMELLASTLGEAAIKNRRLQAQEDPTVIGFASSLEAMGVAEGHMATDPTNKHGKKLYH